MSADLTPDPPPPLLIHQVVLAREQAGAESGKIGDLDMKDCKGPEALLIPGTKDGSILLVKDGADVTVAWTWA